ncbi:MAG: Tfp pilus assembly protein PilX [Halieaceae bacterium]|jgi:Tfp pilus assembly protein PilX
MIHKRLYPMATQQRGVVTLLVALLLLTVATLASIAVGKSIFFEQKLTANDIRSKEAYAAALHGMDYAMEWMQQGNTITWAPDQLVGATSSSVTLVDTDHGTANSGTDSYTHTISLQILTNLAASTVVQLTSTAAASSDSQISRTITQNIVMIGMVSGDGGDSPPIVIEGCMSGVNGTPNLFPQPGQPAVSSLTCAQCGGTPCPVDTVDTGNFDGYVCDAAVLPEICTTPSGPESGWATVALTSTTLNDTQSVWDKLFDVTKEQFRSMAERLPNRFIVLESGYSEPSDWPWTGFISSTNLKNTWGSAEDPVIIFVDASFGCAKMNGGAVIWGMVYYDDPGCKTSGFGNGTLNGTLAMSGDMTSLNANVKLKYYPLGAEFGGGGAGAFNFVSVIPGSWKDF